jgi:WD40 repeat protein
MDGEFVVSGSADATIRVWDTKNGACIHVLGEHVGIVRTLKVSASY